MTAIVGKLKDALQLILATAAVCGLIITAIVKVDRANRNIDMLVEWRTEKDLLDATQQESLDRLVRDIYFPQPAQEAPAPVPEPPKPARKRIPPSSFGPRVSVQ